MWRMEPDWASLMEMNWEDFVVKVLGLTMVRPRVTQTEALAMEHLKPRVRLTVMTMALPKDLRKGRTMDDEKD